MLASIYDIKGLSCWHIPGTRDSSRGCVGELLEIGSDGRGAPAKCAGVHVVVTAIVDMAYETGLRPRLQFLKETIDGAGANRIGIARYLRS